MPLTSSSGRDVNNEVLSVQRSIGFFSDQKTELETCSTRANTLESRINHRLSMPRVSQATQNLCREFIRSIELNKSILSRAQGDINKYLEASNNALGHLVSIQADLSKGRLLRSRRESSDALVARARNICSEISNQQTESGDIHTSMESGGVAAQLRAVNQVFDDIERHMNSNGRRR